MSRGPRPGQARRRPSAARKLMEFSCHAGSHQLCAPTGASPAEAKDRRCGHFRRVRMFMPRRWKHLTLFPLLSPLGSFREGLRFKLLSLFCLHPTCFRPGPPNLACFRSGFPDLACFRPGASGLGLLPLGASGLGLLPPRACPGGADNWRLPRLNYVQFAVPCSDLRSGLAPAESRLSSGVPT
jgi:hypothetical protein